MHILYFSTVANKCHWKKWNVLSGVCLAEGQKAWKARRIVTRAKNKANNETCMNVTTLCEGGLKVLPRKFWKTYHVFWGFWTHQGWVEGGIRFSDQICTDLKNGPDELQKAWKRLTPEINLTPLLIHTPWNGLRKLFGLLRDESKWFQPSMCRINTFSAMSSLSLHDNICKPPPPSIFTL